MHTGRRLSISLARSETVTSAATATTRWPLPPLRGPPLALLRRQGPLWIAYEEGPEKWGKDYGALVADEGNPLYNSRSVRVVCLEDGKLMEPVAELPTSTANDAGSPAAAGP